MGEGRHLADAPIADALPAPPALKVAATGVVVGGALLATIRRLRALYPDEGARLLSGRVYAETGHMLPVDALVRALATPRRLAAKRKKTGVDAPGRAGDLEEENATELVALALDGLPVDMARRVLRWASARFDPESQETEDLRK